MVVVSGGAAIYRTSHSRLGFFLNDLSSHDEDEEIQRPGYYQFQDGIDEDAPALPKSIYQLSLQNDIKEEHIYKSSKRLFYSDGTSDPSHCTKKDSIKIKLEDNSNPADEAENAEMSTREETMEYFYTGPILLTALKS